MKKLRHFGDLNSIIANAEKEKQKKVVPLSFRPSDANKVWIGGNDDANEGTFVWTNGEAGKFLHLCLDQCLNV